LERRCSIGLESASRVICSIEGVIGPSSVSTNGAAPILGQSEIFFLLWGQIKIVIFFHSFLLTPTVSYLYSLMYWHDLVKIKED